MCLFRALFPEFHKVLGLCWALIKMDRKRGGREGERTEEVKHYRCEQERISQLPQLPREARKTDVYVMSPDVKKKKKERIYVHEICYFCRSKS